MENIFNIKDSKLVGIIDRSENNPRNSEGSFIKLSDGRIAFAYSRYHGDSYNDHAPCNICVVYSSDNGESFDTKSYETLVHAEEFGVQNVMSVTLRYMNNGDIGLFYLLKRESPDSGRSSEYRLRRYTKDFSECLGDIKCFPHGCEDYFVVNNDRVLKTEDGRWIIPAATHPKSLTSIGYPFGKRSLSYFYASDDDGVTWKQLRGVLCLADTYSNTGLQEPGIIELPNKVLYSYMRTDLMVQYEAISIDNGYNWFGPKPSRFTSPASPMLIKKNPYTDIYYAVWNPTPICPTNSSKTAGMGRAPYVMAQSLDGINFSEPIFIETDLSKGYCYPAIEFLDEKTLLLSYCSGGQEEDCCLNRTVIRKITLE